MSNSAEYSAIDAAAVTASDTAVLHPTRAIWVGGGTGTVKVRMIYWRGRHSSPYPM